MDVENCECLSEFIKAQMDVIIKHLDEHKYLRSISDREKAISSFVNDYGWLFRELYCTKICPKRAACKIAEKLRNRGDLLQDHIK